MPCHPVRLRRTGYCAGKFAGPRRRRPPAPRRPRLHRNPQLAAAGAVRRARCRRKPAQGRSRGPQAGGDQLDSRRRAGRDRHRPDQHPRVVPGRRHHPRRHGQFRDPLSHQRRRGQAEQAVGLWRLDRQPRPDDDDPARPNAMPALRLRGGPGARRGGHLRDGRRTRADRQHRRQLPGRPKRSRS